MEQVQNKGLNSKGYILGAGFSKAISSFMPLTSELNTDVLNLYKARNQKDFDHLPMVDDLELLLTYLAENQPWQDEKQNLRNRSDFLYLSDLIQSVLIERQEKTLEEMARVENHWALKLLKHWFYNSTSIVSLNYDVLIEMLFNVSGLIKNHSNPYSELYPTKIPPISTRSGVGIWGGNQIHLLMRLYKLHGSINWLYSGSKNFYGEQIYDYGVESFTKKASALEHVAESRLRVKYAADKVPLIIPPTTHKEVFFKNEFIRSLWNQAHFDLSSCDEIYCLGYSFPKSDLMMKFFVRSFLKQNERVKVFVVNSDPGVIYNYEEAFGDKKNILDTSFLKSGNPIRDFVEKIAG